MALLSVEERERAARFHFPEHARRFEVAHGRLRQLLGEVLQVAPGSLRFTVAEHGKPQIAGDARDHDLRFNLSHSGGWGLVGWARGRDIGVDVECWRAMQDESALVHRFFSQAEIADYLSLPLPARSAGFFNCWTRKEAYIKAVGRGLGLPLDSFDVTINSGAAARLQRTNPQFDAGRCWSLAAPEGPADAAIAVVLECEELFVAPKH